MPRPHSLGKAQAAAHLCHLEQSGREWKDSNQGRVGGVCKDVLTLAQRTYIMYYVYMTQEKFQLSVKGSNQLFKSSLLYYGLSNSNKKL